MRNDRYNTYITVHTREIVYIYAYSHSPPVVKAMLAITNNTDAAKLGVEKAMWRVTRYE